MEGMRSLAYLSIDKYFPADYFISSTYTVYCPDFTDKKRVSARFFCSFLTLS